MVEKVLAYITRWGSNGLELLVFEHVDAPEAGIQVPAGTVEEGETPAEAVLREAEEEVGLTGLTVERYIGAFPYFHPYRQELQRRHVFHLTRSHPLPDTWEHRVLGRGEDRGMCFRCFWMDMQTAARVLVGGQGLYLPSEWLAGSGPGAG
jgi:8-oxo-dGTP diphosphatase